ncbi:SUKH-4 family immunity protein [Streptomyces sp. NPDC001832]|uniref:SUKH-4 family immunity protein n=1 Tax=Streptomyces sp. NPDC001832 TaxID=3154527 RepID=UPI00331E0BC1
MVTRADLVSVFGVKYTFLVPAATLAEIPLPDAPRAELISIGIPSVVRSAVYIDRDIVSGIPTYGDWCESGNLSFSPEAGQLLRIGYWHAGSICLSPSSGAVYYVSPYEATEVELMSSSPAQLSECMMIAHKDGQASDFLPSHEVMAEREAIVEKLLAVDEPAVSPVDSPWRVLAKEVTGPEYRD